MTTTVQGERISLYYRADSSDKEYHAHIEPSGGGFIVSFAFGRRGSTLQTGTKTATPVDYATARKVYDKLVASKTAKGYTPGSSGTPYQHTDKEARATGILPQLLNAIDESAAEKVLTDPAWLIQEKLDGKRVLVQRTGESEQRTRQALRIADAMAPCVLMVDEVERALSGVASSGQTDSGVSARMFGTLLTWLNDHESDVFVVMTCNQIGQLPPEFTRAERFDGVFFVDLPTAPQRQAIWKIYLDRFGLDPEQTIPGAGAGDENWTGAEIRACCRLAKLLEVPLVEAAQNVVPVAVTAADAVEKLRGWAEGRCLSADNPGVYRRGRTSGGGGKVARRVTRPSDN